MSSVYDEFEVVDRDPRRHRHHHHRDREVIRETVRDERTPRYTTVQETYVKKAPPASAAPDTQYVSRQTELIRRPAVREDSDLSVEEVRRDFPPPGTDAYYRQTGMDDRYGSSRRARSAERDEYEGSSRRSRGDGEGRKGRQNLVVEEQVTRRRSLSRNQKIIAAVSGAALAVGGKELWDRRQAANGSPQERNVLGNAAIGAAGAFAAYEGAELYAKHGGKMEEKVHKQYAAYKGKDGPAEVYYSSEEEMVKKPEKKSRRKSIVEGALGLVGAAGAAKALTGGGGGDHDRRGGRDSDSRYDSRSRSRAGGKGENVGAAKLQQAAKAALLAGAVEAFRVRKEPGGWGGAKAQRIITAAIGSGAVDAVADRNPDKHSKRHIIESVIGGLAANRAVNGSKKEIDDDGDGRSVRGGSRSRSRSRSKSRGGGGAGGGLAALATAAAAGLAGKKLLDNRSRSRSRRRRSPSMDSYDSRSPSPRRDRKDRHKRSKSVTDYARKGLAAIGLGEAVDDERDHRSRDVQETRVSRKTRYSGDSSDDEYDRRPRRNGTRGDPYGDSRGSGSGGGGRRQKDGKKDRRKAEGKMSEDMSGSDSELGSSSGDEKARKKMKGKQLLTAGLATVATIHAAHNVYASMEKRQARHKAVQEGEMSPEEAKKLKTKATMQDVASIGIAALGIKGAISEWKEMQE